MVYNDRYRITKVTKIQWIVLLLVLALGLGLRLWWISTNSPRNLTHDEIGYHEMTRQFLNKGFLGYYSNKPNAFVTPGYPLFLAVVYKAVEIINGPGTDPLPTVRIIQAIIGVATIAMIFLVGRRAGRPWVGLVASLIWAVYQPSLMASTRILTETLYTFILLVYIYLVMVLFQVRKYWLHGVCGLVLAVTLLVRPALAPVIVVPYVLDYWQRRDWRFAFGFLVTIICFTAVMLPWWVRNYTVTNKMVVFATQTGNPFLRGTDPYDPFDKQGPSIIENVPEENQMQVGIQRIREGLRTDPLLWIKWFTVGKFTYMWQDPWGMVRFWLRAYHLIFIVILGWLGVVRAFLNPRLRWLALIPVIVTVLQLAFIPITRYMYPLTPIMAILAVCLTADVGGWVKKAVKEGPVNTLRMNGENKR